MHRPSASGDHLWGSCVVAARHFGRGLLYHPEVIRQFPEYFNNDALV
jgi:hypothetical protein